MYPPEVNSFVFLRVSTLPETKLRKTLRFLGKKYFPRKQSLSIWLYTQIVPAAFPVVYCVFFVSFTSLFQHNFQKSAILFLVFVTAHIGHSNQMPHCTCTCCGDVDTPALDVVAWWIRRGHCAHGTCCDGGGASSSKITDTNLAE